MLKGHGALGARCRKARAPRRASNANETTSKAELRGPPRGPSRWYTSAGLMARSEARSEAARRRSSRGSPQRGEASNSDLRSVAEAKSAMRNIACSASSESAVVSSGHSARISSMSWSPSESTMGTPLSDPQARATQAAAARVARPSSSGPRPRNSCPSALRPMPPGVPLTAAWLRRRCSSNQTPTARPTNGMERTQSDVCWAAAMPAGSMAAGGLWRWWRYR
mmetsp:Transcript_91945/g.232099  ORF Transcript_91945/g.232099 Transcript_91945/m.232099 type:complete len:223 (-) Transcript_91945:10-678(-)